jgi:hypothetical protein
MKMLLVANINYGRTIAISAEGKKKIIKILEEEYCLSQTS